MRLWSFDNFNLLRTFVGHTGSIEEVKFSEDETQLFSGGDDKRIKLWSLDDIRNDRITIGSHTDQINCASFSGNGTYLATGSRDKTAKIWLLDGTLQYSLIGHNDEVSSLSFNPNSSQLATLSIDNIIKLWRVDNGELIRSITLTDSFMEQGFDFISNIKHLFSCPCPQIINNYTQPITNFIYTSLGLTHATNQNVTEPDSAFYIGFTADGERLLARKNNDIRFISINSGEVVNSISVIQAEQMAFQEIRNEESASYLFACYTAVQSDLQRVARIENDKDHSLKIYRTTPARQPREINKQNAVHVAFSPCNTYIAISDHSKNINLWSNYFVDPKMVFSIQIDSVATNLTFTHSHNNNIFLASGHDDGSLRYWQLMKKRSRTNEPNTGEEPYLQLIWSTYQNPLSFKYASIKDSKNLSSKNWNSLYQRETHLNEEWSEARPILLNNL